MLTQILQVVEPLSVAAHSSGSLEVLLRGFVGRNKICLKYSLVKPSAYFARTFCNDQRSLSSTNQSVIIHTSRRGVTTSSGKDLGTETLLNNEKAQKSWTRSQSTGCPNNAIDHQRLSSFQSKGQNIPSSNRGYADDCSYSGNGGVRVRFAPSPTGHMHLGGLRTALYNFLFARNNGGKFLVRMEDTDQARLVPGAAKDLEQVLRWAGLKPDESPMEGGSAGPYTQSERLPLYQKHAQILIDTGQAYRCFCTPRRLELLKREASRTRQVNKYDRKCLSLSKEEVAAKLSAGESSTVRFLLSPHPEPWHDLVYGDVTHDVFELEGDPIILKSDGFPTYHLANVVDDHLMGITHVLRGVEWQASTPKHLLMYRAFGWTPPYFAHLPLIVNSDGSKLSKRQGDLQIESLKAEGFFPEAVVNFVSHVGGGFKDLESQGSLDVCHDLAHLSKRFDLNLLNTNPGRLEMHRLSSLNRVILKEKVADLESRQELLDLCLRLVEETVKAKNLEADSFSKEEAESYLVWATRERITTIKELVADDLIFLWALPKDHIQLSETPKSVIEEVQQAILETKTIDKSLVKILKKIGKNSGLKFPKLMEDLRVLLTGKREGPPVLEVIQVLGKESVARRLQAYLTSS